MITKKELFKLELVIRQHITSLNILRELPNVNENPATIAFLDQTIYNLSEALRNIKQGGKKK